MYAVCGLGWGIPGKVAGLCLPRALADRLHVTILSGTLLFLNLVGQPGFEL